jgi:hypothetical protein
MNDITMTVKPDTNPIPAAVLITISVAITSLSEYANHVRQLGTQISELSSRKKSTRHGRGSNGVATVLVVILTVRKERH